MSSHLLRMNVIHNLLDGTILEDFRRIHVDVGIVISHKAVEEGYLNVGLLLKKKVISVKGSIWLSE